VGLESLGKEPKRLMEVAKSAERLCVSPISMGSGMLAKFVRVHNLKPRKLGAQVRLRLLRRTPVAVFVGFVLFATPARLQRDRRASCSGKERRHTCLRRAVFGRGHPPHRPEGDVFERSSHSELERAGPGCAERSSRSARPRRHRRLGRLRAARSAGQHGLDGCDGRER
jgi:hypothetical protein